MANYTDATCEPNTLLCITFTPQKLERVHKASPDCLRHAACECVLWFPAGSHPLLLALSQAGDPDEQEQQSGEAGGDQAQLQPPDARRGKELTAT